MTIKELIDRGAERLAGCGIADSAVDAWLLYSLASGLDRTHLILALREQPASETEEKYEELILRRSQGEPLQYITGIQEFMGLPFRVAPGVLIPRPETELLVEKALAIAKVAGASAGSGSPDAAGISDASGAYRVLDIGCGSGAIGVSMAVLMPSCQVTCTDISPEALAAARANAEALSAEVEFLEGDLLEPAAGRQFDMILSNPPYIADEVIRGLAPEVREHEPMLALSGGEDGLAVYRRLIPELPKALAGGGVVLLEIGYDQMDAVRELLTQTGAFSCVDGCQDLAGLDRIVYAKKM